MHTICSLLQSIYCVDIHLNHTISSWRPRIGLCCSYRPALQKLHQLPHRVRHCHLCLALNKNIQLRVLSWSRLFACSVVASLRSNRRASRFQNLGHVRPVGNCPSCPFCKLLALIQSCIDRNLRGKSLISSVAWKAPASGPRLSIGTPDLITPARLSRAWISATAEPTLSSGFFDALVGSLSVLCTVILPSRSIPLGTPSS